MQWPERELVFQGPSLWPFASTIRFFTEKVCMRNHDHMAALFQGSSLQTNTGSHQIWTRYLQRRLLSSERQSCCTDDQKLMAISFSQPMALSFLKTNSCLFPGKACTGAHTAIQYPNNALLQQQCHDHWWFFFSHFVWGKIMAVTRQGRGKRHLLDSSWAAKLFGHLTELSWSDVRDTCASSHHFFLAQKKRKKFTECQYTDPLKFPKTLAWVVIVLKARQHYLR